ncbi:uncharacterized protein FA14DRAFT_60963 [Meira miltonrushii]|uniref:Uncharacterized protein n=1 Tax=Meira miltonrushii TaxID=1280837 RepID=A0A316VA47_9BASI|nr:uncharacterized protein FA14DRAFT_60963 [Meira miltonrushii]PWN33321.1 hypothetical protein FA14DRAFT_60963 [Meira miltonrushii]
MTIQHILSCINRVLLLCITISSIVPPIRTVEINVYRILEDGAKNHREHFPELSDEHTFKELFNHLAHESEHAAGHNHTHSDTKQSHSKSHVNVQHHIQHHAAVGTRRGKKKHS